MKAEQIDELMEVKISAGNANNNIKRHKNRISQLLRRILRVVKLAGHKKKLKQYRKLWKVVLKVH